MDHQQFDDLCDEVERQRSRLGVPGVMFGVSVGGERFVRGFGLANARLGIAAEENTLVQIGSITKTFVGTAMMRLVEAGKIDLDSTVRSHIPTFAVADPVATKAATVRHLMTHLSGFDGDFFLDVGDGDDALERYAAELHEARSLAPLGSHYSYNNAGFSLLGLIIQNVTGESFEDALTKLVIDPLELDRAYLRAKDIMTERFFVGHSANTTPVPHWALSRAVVPAGGVVTDMDNLLKYGEFHCLDDASILSRESRQAMRTSHYDFPDQSAGLTWFLHEAGGESFITHSGGTAGQNADLWIAPSRDTVFAFATNSVLGGALYRPLKALLMDALLDVKPVVPAVLENPEACDLEPYVGRYERHFGATEVAIVNGALVARTTTSIRFPDQNAPLAPPEPPIELVPTVNGDQLYIRGGAQDGRLIDAVARDDGSIGWLRIGFRLSRRVD